MSKKISKKKAAKKPAKKAVKKSARKPVAKKTFKLSVVSPPAEADGIETRKLNPLERRQVAADYAGQIGETTDPKRRTELRRELRIALKATVPA